MSFFSSLVPDREFEKYSDVTPELLESEGISALLVDIDNTLAPYEQPEPDETHFGWLKRLRESGVSCALISNNKLPRVERFARELGIPAYADCKKPRTKHLRRAVRAGRAARRAAIFGVQIFTDCLAAKRLGMKAYIVPPIKDKKNLFFRFKRLLEKPFLRAGKQNRKEY